MISKKFISELIKNKSKHNVNSSYYRSKKRKLLNTISKSNFIKGKTGEEQFENLGKIFFPYIEFGKINSLDLLGLDELIIFSFYWSKRNIYKNVADLGANIGLHSIILEKCGFNVECYEPDPNHIKIMKKLFRLNNIKNVSIIQKAISIKKGTMNFVRLKGNTTGSHLQKSKKNIYGEIDTFKVDTISINKIFKKFDFIKMDIEGEEANAIKTLSQRDFSNTDMILEVGTPENARIIYDHLCKININMFSQKIGWSKIKTLEDIPTSHKEGSLFISKGQKMLW